MDRNNIFNDVYPHNFYGVVNQENYEVLLGLAGSANEGKVSCLAPICGSNYPMLEKRKAFWVQYLINFLTAGGSIDSITEGCSCDELACQCTLLAKTLPLAPGVVNGGVTVVDLPDASTSVDISTELAAIAAAGGTVTGFHIVGPIGVSGHLGAYGLDSADGTTFQWEAATTTATYDLHISWAVFPS